MTFCAIVSTVNTHWFFNNNIRASITLEGRAGKPGRLTLGAELNNATGADFGRVIALLEAGAVDIDPWITHRVAFGADVVEQFPIWLDPRAGSLKPSSRCELFEG